MSMPGPSGGPSGSSFGSGHFTTPGRQQHHQSFPISNSAASPSIMTDRFTPQMRDRQARGKDPYQSSDGSDEEAFSDRDLGPGSRLRLGSGRFEKEDFARAEARQKALAFLDNPELLRMYALANEDNIRFPKSIPGARLHFTKLLCGFEDEEQKHTGPQPGLSSASNTRQHQADRRRGGDSHRSSTN